MSLRLILVFLLLLAPALRAPSAEPVPKVIGVWEGTVWEGRDAYSLRMEINRLKPGPGAGRTRYFAGIDCGGALSYVRRRGGTYVFTEVIDSGSGCDDGRIELTPAADGSLRFRWYRKGERGGPAATARLIRYSPIIRHR